MRLPSVLWPVSEVWVCLQLEWPPDYYTGLGQIDVSIIPIHEHTEVCPSTNQVKKQAELSSVYSNLLLKNYKLNSR